MAEVKFSGALKDVTGERKTEVKASNVEELVDELKQKYGEGFEERLVDDGELKRFVNLYVNGEDVRHSEGLETSLEEDDEVSLLPAVSGG